MLFFASPSDLSLWDEYQTGNLIIKVIEKKKESD
jgi:hypothetical protein